MRASGGAVAHRSLTLCQNSRSASGPSLTSGACRDTQNHNCAPRRSVHANSRSLTTWEATKC
eukprot:13147731-Alexandrium_andersonii.AAC.1